MHFIEGLLFNIILNILNNLDVFPLQYYSLAHYTANDNGEIDLETASSSGGSYTGVFPAGLLTCVQPGPGMKAHSRLLKQNISTPFKV